MKLIDIQFLRLFSDYSYFFCLFYKGEKDNCDCKNLPRGLIGFGKVDVHSLFAFIKPRKFYFFTIFWLVFTTEKKQ